ncbi:VOC family protein [uncultured Maritalea sp.]|jgi:lactoylglutathione lyase|uniref:VOC family protein n=1 Tax=uncultured Maritalea sp. TaxID=757249 RepID=UPI0026399564|nr:VOC family protein [uncultured Maritalea sp.]
MKLGYTIIYVKDVTATVEFFEHAFGLKRRFIHEAGDYAEMETGDTALTFALEDAAADNDIAVYPNRARELPAAWEVCLVTDDVDSAYKKAVQNGAKPILSPTQKPWGQVVSYVRDLNGCLVELASPVAPQ